jgi:hypothetical protein
MRRPLGIAGATLIYGKGEQHPDMILALQFLLDDLRREGRQISGVRLAGDSLRLRVEHFELAASLASTPLPVAAFNGVLRPELASRAAIDWPHDLARGRLLYAIRHHRQALGVLLRARLAGEGVHREEALDLSSECRAIVSALVEAAPPQFVLWQASGVLFTLAEFRTVTQQRLDAPGDPGSAMYPKPAPIARVQRPSMPDWTKIDDRPANARGSERPEASVTGHASLPVPVIGPNAPRDRFSRMLNRSVGNMFRRANSLQRPRELPSPARNERRLARAFDRASAGVHIERHDRAQRRRLRLFGCAVLTASLIIILPPLAWN